VNVNPIMPKPPRPNSDLFTPTTSEAIKAGLEAKVEKDFFSGNTCSECYNYNLAKCYDPTHNDNGTVRCNNFLNKKGGRLANKPW